MVLINSVLNVLMKFSIFYFYFYEQKYSVFTFVFHRFVVTLHIFLTLIFAQCIRAMYMYIFQTKVKSLTMNVFFNNLWFYVSYNFYRSGSYRDRSVDHLTISANQLNYKWICWEYFAWMCIVTQKFGAVVVFCFIEVFIEIRKYHDYRLCTCALIRVQ